jgi:hypothetical protein
MVWKQLRQIPQEAQSINLPKNLQQYGNIIIKTVRFITAQKYVIHVHFNCTSTQHQYMQTTGIVLLLQVLCLIQNTHINNMYPSDIN